MNFLVANKFKGEKATKSSCFSGISPGLRCNGRTSPAAGLWVTGNCLRTVPEQLPQTLHVVSQIHQADFYSGTHQADGAHDVSAHLRLCPKYVSRRVRGFLILLCLQLPVCGNFFPSRIFWRPVLANTKLARKVRARCRVARVILSKR